MVDKKNKCIVKTTQKRKKSFTKASLNIGNLLVSEDKETLFGITGISEDIILYFNKTNFEENVT